ncbi:MAG: formylmethanofuran dehydrogenase subunit E family protein [Methanoregula sp.]|jgi:formylmethanofuran dehydrogenase subunit E
MHDHNHECHFLNLKKEYSVADLAAFHGHLGPFIVLGYRIGKYAKEQFCNDPFELSASVYCAGKPPESCIVDGVQLGSGCTLGKRNIGIVESPEIRCVFTTQGKTLTVTPKPETRMKTSGHSESAVEKFAEELYNWPDDQLFSCTLR